MDSKNQPKYVKSVIQIQVFISIKLNTFWASNLKFLNTTLFLWVQLFQTQVIQCTQVIFIYENVIVYFSPSFCLSNIKRVN